jgi:hypothetical protein
MAANLECFTLLKNVLLPSFQVNNDKLVIPIHKSVMTLGLKKYKMTTSFCALGLVKQSIVIWIEIDRKVCSISSIRIWLCWL